MILIGDATGLNEPLTGEGIFYALKSAQIAAKYLKDFFTGNSNALKNYEKAINKEILPGLKAGYFFKKISPIFSPFVFRLIKKNDYYWDVLYRLFSGEKTFLEIKKLLRPDRLIKKIYERKRVASKSSR
jgi:flavin-dependent dehydrogenase